MGSSSSSSSSNSSTSKQDEHRSVFISDTKYNFERFNETRYAKWRDEIKKKLKDEMKKNPNLENDIRKLYNLDLDSFVTALGDTPTFKKTFLNPCLNSKVILAEIDEEFEELKSYDSLQPQEIEHAIERMNNRKKKLADSQMKFLLTTTNVSTWSVIRKFAIASGYQFGALHTALSINGVVLEWGRGLCGESLVCPTINLADLLFSLDVESPSIFTIIKNFVIQALSALLNVLTFGLGGSFLIGTIIDNQLTEIAEACTKFNREKTYHFSRCNCQDFVTYLCYVAGIELNFDGELKRVVKEIISNGTCQFKFRNENFNNRQELDRFVMNDINFASLCDNDKKLLFVYRNLFDSYSKKDPTNSLFKSSDEALRYWEMLMEKLKFN